MMYQVETTEGFDKEFKKLDRSIQRLLKGWIEKNLISCQDPRAKGKALRDNKSGQWRYRVGDYRLLCAIEEDRLVILALSVGHRKHVCD